MRRASSLALVAFAGPLSNVLQAVVIAGIAWGLVLAGITPASHGSGFGVLGLFLVMNVILAVFNLLPVHPLDGGKVLAWALPSRAQGIDDFLAKWGFVILLALMFSSALSVVFEPVTLFALKGMALVDREWVDAYFGLMRRG